MLAVAAVGLLLAGCGGFLPPVGEPLATRSVDVASTVAPTGEYIVVFGGPALPDGAREALEAAGGQVVREIVQIGVAVVRSADPEFPAAAARILGVIEVGPDLVLSLDLPIAVGAVDEPAGIEANDLYVRLQWDIKRVGGVAETWDIQRGAGAVVAVLDTGVYHPHPDIAPNYLYGRSYVMDHWHPVYGFVPAEDELDYHGHGTHVAGSIAAPITQGRIIGVAPEAGIANYKVLTKYGYGYVSWILQAIIEAADDGCQVINMSLGGYRLMQGRDGAGSYIAYARATQYAWQRGALVVAASGNNALDLTKVRPYVHVPSGTPAAISVNATGSLDELAWYSNYGASDSHISAPGGGRANIPFSYCVSAWSPLSIVLPAYYVWSAGTSMAAPKVSGVAALIYGQNPSFGPAQVRARLFQTAEDIGKPGFDYEFGHGLVHAYRAVTATRARR